MKVYTLPDTRQFHVLLTGETEFVLEFADKLQASDIPFRILPSQSDLAGMSTDADIVGTEFAEMFVNTDAYGEYTDHVTADVGLEAGTFTHVVELSAETVAERETTLSMLAFLNPNATFVVSALLATATEMGMFADIHERVLGVTLAPSIISDAQCIDMSRGLNTVQEHTDKAMALFTAMGYGVELVEDRVGLVQMRILAMLINEAAFAVMEGVATPEDIDSAMKLGVNYPKGLLAWADEISIPVVTLILDGLYREYLQERYRPCVLLKQYMRAGWMGKEAGRGFYIYE